MGVIPLLEAKDLVQYNRITSIIKSVQPQQQLQTAIAELKKLDDAETAGHIVTYILETFDPIDKDDLIKVYQAYEEAVQCNKDTMESLGQSSFELTNLLEDIGGFYIKIRKGFNIEEVEMIKSSFKSSYYPEDKEGKAIKGFLHNVSCIDQYETAYELIENFFINEILKNEKSSIMCDAYVALQSALENNLKNVHNDVRKNYLEFKNNKLKKTIAALKEKLAN